MFNRLWKREKSLKDPLFTFFFLHIIYLLFFELHTKGGWPPARILMHSFTDTTGLLLDTLWSQTIKLNHNVSNLNFIDVKRIIPYCFLRINYKVFEILNFLKYYFFSEWTSYQLKISLPFLSSLLGGCNSKATANPSKSDDKIVQEMYNWSEVHSQKKYY